MFFFTEPFLEDYGYISSVDQVKEVIAKILSAIEKDNLSRVDVTITLSNGVHTAVVFYRGDETLEHFQSRLLKEAEKHL